jgi:hypothetical protein
MNILALVLCKASKVFGQFLLHVAKNVSSQRPGGEETWESWLALSLLRLSHTLFPGQHKIM